MKKSKIPFLLATIMLLSSCRGGGGSNVKKDVVFEENLDNLVLRNNCISLSFAKDNGSLFSIVNKERKIDFISGSVGGSWAMMVDTSTSDPFLSNPTGNNTYLVTSRRTNMTYSHRQVEEGIELSFLYNVTVNGQSGITVIEKVFLNKGDDKATFDYEVINEMSNSVVVSFTAAEISGIKQGEEDWTLFWPYNEGKLYENAVSMVKNATDEKARMSMVYPVPSSLQLLQIYNGSSSLFYYVEDDTAEFKEFNFGCFTNIKQYDYQGVTAADKVSMSATQYPFVKSGQSKELHRVVIGTSNHGDYYDGSNYYREFLTAKMSRNHSNYVKNWTGFSALIGSRYGNKHFASYTQTTGYDTYYSSWVLRGNPNGIYSTAILGWHEGGFDSNYPDYEFIEGPGFGESNLRHAFEAVHNDGNQMYPYINLHIADVASKWSNTIYDTDSGMKNIERAAIKYKGFKDTTPLEDFESYMQLETYGTATTYFAMCPSSELFIDAIIDACTRLRRVGADGFWFDQLMQMPANLCFDKTHGHLTPATAMGEGYKTLFTRLEAMMAQEGSGDYVLSSEGVCDAYIKYIDVCGYLWSRKLGARDTGGDGHNMSPEITRYTMTSKFLGIEGAGTTTASDDEFARAFVMCDPFLGDPYKPSTGVWTSLYNSEPTYLNGRYMDMCGLSTDNLDFIYGITVSEDKTKAVINIYNYSLDDSNGNFIEVDLKRLGIESSISSVMDMRSGDSLSFNGGKIMLPSIEVNGVCSILLTFGR